MAIYKGSDFIGVNSVKEKKVYVEVPEGSTIDDMSESNTIAISPEQYAALQDATGYRIGDYLERNLPQMIAKMKDDYFRQHDFLLFPQYHSTPWVRPQGWPDLDSLNLQMEGDDFIYMTYDNTGGKAAIALHAEKVTNGQNISVTIGHINNGEYIVDETISGTSNNYLRWLTSSDADYPVVRVTGDIKVCYTYGVSLDGATQQHRRQPIVERIAYVPHLTSLVGNANNNSWGVYTLQKDIVNNGDGSTLTTIAYAWAYCRNLEVLDITGLKTQNVTNMDSTFRQLLKITSLDLKHLSVDKVTNFNNLFSDSKALSIIDLTGWNTVASTSFNSTFNGCNSLKQILGLANFKTDKVTTFYALFNGCYMIEELPVENWNTEKVTTLQACFGNCRKIVELDLSHWNVNKVTSLYNCFNGCWSLKRINFTGWETGTLSGSQAYIFINCYSLSYLDVSWLHINSSCTAIYEMFYNCFSLQELHLNNWDVSGISTANYTASSVFTNCYSLRTLTGIENFDFSHLSNSLSSMFSSCYCLEEINVNNWNVASVTNLSSMFNSCYNLRSLNLSNWNTASCTTFASMFNACYSLTTVGNISSWNTSNVTNMSSMFANCWSLRELPAVQNWDYSNVTTIDSMFNSCTSLETVTWINVSLPKCTVINQLFRYCYNLKYANLSGWSIPVVTNNTSYYHTLGQCWCLRDLVGFPIPAAYTNLGFQDCENLSYNSLMVIINALPTVTGTHTLRIPAVSNQLLSAADKAIATGKGWTIANS